MPDQFSWAKAKPLLNESEKERLAAIALTHIAEIKPNWKLIAPQVGNTEGSASVLHGKLLRKLRDNEATLAEGEVPQAATPGKAKGEAGSAKKRKTPAKNTAGENDGELESPSKKARKPKAKKADTPQSLKSEPVTDFETGSLFGGTEASTVILGSQAAVPNAGLFDFDGDELEFP